MGVFVTEFFYIFGSIFLVSLLSFIGAFTLGINEKSLKKIMLLLVGFSAGALFGDAFIHLLPEAVEESGFEFEISLAILSGIAVFFILEKIIKWHHHHNVSEKNEIHSFGYMNLLGDALHNFIDGALIAGSYLASVQVGVATTIAVVLHEIPQEMGDFGVLLHSGFSKRKALLFNFFSALTAVFGAIIVLYFYSIIDNFEVLLVSFTVGGFVYIAGSDLIPELHHEEGIKNSIAQIIVFLLGIAAMGALLVLE
ncbi:MAG: ZIP family metal transporter [Candidatus Diapherotrites archaeon]|nr:ZIP family metal transporter [Candidatus Diapherotrites archaeon]